MAAWANVTMNIERWEGTMKRAVGQFDVAASTPPMCKGRNEGREQVAFASPG